MYLAAPILAASFLHCSAVMRAAGLGAAVTFTVAVAAALASFASAVFARFAVGAAVTTG